MGCVLVTGGAGYIGSHAVYAFLDARHDVVVVDDLSTGCRSVLPDDLPFYQIDVGDAAALESVFTRHPIDGVLHFAGSIVVPESVREPGAYYRNNTVASLTLAQACLRHGVSRLVFSSTAAVYGIPMGGVAHEHTPTCPINPYGWSKLMTEQILSDLSRAHGLSCAVLRYFNVAGADPEGRTGQSTPNATHLIKIATQVAAGAREGMTLHGTDYDTPDGTCIRDFIHVSDLAAAHLAAYEALTDDGSVLTLNCGNGRGYSVREVIAAVEAVAGRPITVTVGDRRPGDAPVLVADGAAIRDRLGWQPRHGLEDMIRTALVWEQQTAAPLAEGGVA